MIVAREYRVWCENGDLLACATVHDPRAGWWRVEPSPFSNSETTAFEAFRGESDARCHASGLAERWADEARAACQCGTDGTDGECGVMEPHGISVQAVEDDQDVTRDYLINGS